MSNTNLSPHIAAILAAHKQKGQKSNESKANFSKIPQEDTLKHYATPRSPRQVYRLLPPTANDELAPKGDPFKVAYFHEVKIAGNFKKLFCLEKNDGNPCPLCDRGKELLTKANELRNAAKKVADLEEDKAAKERILQPSKEAYILSQKYKPKLFYILKLVERVIMEDGKTVDGDRIVDGKVKFWRFKDNHLKKGPYDTILELITEQGDIFDVNEGMDLIIKTNLNDKGYPTISAIITSPKTQLFTNKALEAEIINNSLTWKDLMRPSSYRDMNEYQFLEAVRDGKAPYYDKKEGKMVYPGQAAPGTQISSISLDSEDNEDDEFEGNSFIETTNNTVRSQATNDLLADLDDLPF